MEAQMPPNMAGMAGQPDPMAAPPMEDPTASPEQGMGEDEFMQEGQRALEAIGTVLYKDQASSDKFIGMISPEKKIDSVVRASILLVTQIDKQLNLDPEILAGAVVMAAGELMELSEAAHGMTFSEMEQKQVVMTAFEGILEAYDVDAQEAANVVAEVGPEGEQQGITDYEEALNA